MPEIPRRGLNLRRYCAVHESEVQSGLDRGEELPELLERHARRLSWLQHERLAHLLVTCLFSVLFLFAVALCTAGLGLGAYILAAVTLIVLVFYVRHYFFLENTVQRWYLLYDELARRIR